MSKIFVLLVVGAIVLGFKTQEEEIIQMPFGWPKPIYEFSRNPLSAEKIALGRLLFYDPLLSANSKISCAGCHSQYTAFAHVDHALSHGIDNRTGTRNSPALMNLAWNKSFMWDGAINHLDMQALFPISNHKEMDENIEQVVNKLQLSARYPQLFYAAFGDSLITGEHILKAIAQFELTLISADSKYDSVMRGQSVFTMQEQNGYRLFKKNCAACHKEPLFTNQSFENNGLPIDSILHDFGRVNVTHLPQDSLKFKVPTLRNIEFSYPYMHDGRFKKLSEVLTHYTSGILKSPTLSVELKTPINLSSNDKVDIIAFLLTLTDRHFLFNEKYAYPKILLTAK
ncbi:cytochrome c peroxidase [soil metagenome]